MPIRGLMTSRPRPCSEWWCEPCVLAARQGEMSLWCEHVGACMYSLERHQLDEQLLEYYDAWCQRRVCMVWYRPAIGDQGDSPNAE